ncbi:putative toxin-antitoxin system toxin component, PIN family [Candidatus Kuenenbacteria bacterium RIFCSPHIGHO2_02_FULL_39_13]|uniref:Putative toxin-antitoxin system toxin component, PIN family n=1 Tax=Candidatus Kuenenbacteria bacterium RIFCSPHIGHO2_02_FULL_39_13 TaxID=1798561 RepID=A0A1F6FN74_9BACT|nr:MAG: putative toxin-antitoxin system toxin component, PIN family [Candidatus Kuenenbacteria bacterium RIFCSPHIGHO2_02_FULL_39_13]
MLTIVIDTNILIDAWQDDFSYARRIIDEVVAGNVRAVASHKIWQEYQLIFDKLINNSRHYEMAQKFFYAVEEVQPKTRVRVVKYDQQDNKFFDAAIAGKAKYIISNDCHLWEIGEYQGIQVLKAEDFWAEYKSIDDKSGQEEWKKWMGNIIGKGN